MGFQNRASLPPGACGRAIPISPVDRGDATGPAPGETARCGPATRDETATHADRLLPHADLNRESFRGGWFHTGDLGRLDTTATSLEGAEGAIRRRARTSRRMRSSR